MPITEKKKAVLSEDEYRQHCDDYDGFCLACGEWGEGGVEPDARGYECEGCGKKAVYGAEELSIMGSVEFT